MTPTEEFAQGIDQGDYRKALAAYRKAPDPQKWLARATEAFLLAMAGDHDAAARTMAGVVEAEVIEMIVRGERERAALWSRARPHAATPGPAIAGNLVYRNGETRAFTSIADSDDGIGPRLETYGPDGLRYIPFATMRGMGFVPPRNFIDCLVTRAQVDLLDGKQLFVLVPLLYAESSTSNDASIRAGRTTFWSYAGKARHALGQRDFVLDGGAMVGMESVGAFELTR